MNLPEIQTGLSKGKFTLESIVGNFLKTTEENKDLNVFITLFDKEAIEQAKEIDSKLQAGKAGKLAGCVLSVKDVIAVKDKPLTCGSKILSEFISCYDATAVERLKKEDAIIIGKVNCDEFAMGSSNENSFFGPVKNPYDKSRVPGGSSGASAVSVAAGMCNVSLGSETGGSVRQPASFCGVTGLKVTYGRISRFGLVAFASSFDSIGIIGKSAFDIAKVLEVIAGYDEKDSTSASFPVENYSFLLKNKFKPGQIKFGFPKEYFGGGISSDILNGIKGKIDSLKQSGFDVKEISLPHSEFVIQAYYILSSAEASSNLARYDGVRYGFRTDNCSTLNEMYVNARSEGFGDEVKRRIMLGTYVLSAGYYDEYYKKAQKVRRLIKNDFENAFGEVDYIITPATPHTAFKIGEKINDPLSMYLNDIYTASVNLAGIPAISVPAGFDNKGLPFGVQIIGRKFDETGLLKICSLIENL